MSNSKNTKNMEKVKESNRELTKMAIDNIIALLDEYKYRDNEIKDEIEKLIKQGLYLIKYIVATNFTN